VSKKKKGCETFLKKAQIGYILGMWAEKPTEPNFM